MIKQLFSFLLSLVFFYFLQIPASLSNCFVDKSSSPNDILSWNWSFGDGQTSTGQFAEHEEEVIEDCEALFSYTQVEGSFTLLFSDHSTSPLSIVSWEWDFGDGTWSHLRNPSHTFPHEGEYTVCLWIIGIESSCSHRACLTVIVHPENPPCQPLYSAHMDHGGDVVQLHNASIGTTLNTTYLWDFGDGTTSNEENPQHQYTEAGIYEVCLFLSDPTISCSNHYCHPFVFHMAWHEINPHYAIQNEHTSQPVITRSVNGGKLVTYTNPVRDEISIEYLVYSDAHVGFEMFDLTGNRILSSFYGIEEKGEYFKTIQLKNIHSGLYVLIWTVGNERIPINLTVGE